MKNAKLKEKDNVSNPLYLFIHDICFWPGYLFNLCSFDYHVLHIAIFLRPT